MTPRYQLTPRAFDDLKQIGRYTLQKWGKQQRNRYLLDLDQRFAWLTRHPRLGRYPCRLTARILPKVTIVSRKARI